jgi:serine/threonine protein kinase
MGVVYLGVDVQTGQRVAVKRPRREYLSYPAFVQQFAAEVAAAKRVNGHFSARILRADMKADIPWFASEYIPGLTVREVVEKFGPFGEDSLWALASALYQALEVMHGVHVVHRDLTANNVILGDRGPRVIDFGVAHTRGVPGMDQQLTVAGMIGTLHYLSPERIQGGPPQPSWDVFSLGCLLYFAATGSMPFGSECEDSGRVCLDILHADVALDDLPEGLRRLIIACLVKDPEPRSKVLRVYRYLPVKPRFKPEGVGWVPTRVGTHILNVTQVQARADQATTRRATS